MAKQPANVRRALQVLNQSIAEFYGQVKSTPRFRVARRKGYVGWWIRDSAYPTETGWRGNCGEGYATKAEAEKRLAAIRADTGIE